jgi:hypothetical protein
VEEGEEVELVMRVKDRYQRGQIRHRDLSREAARTRSSRTSLEMTVHCGQRSAPHFDSVIFSQTRMYKTDYAVIYTIYREAL